MPVTTKHAQAQSHSLCRSLSQKKITSVYLLVFLDENRGLLLDIDVGLVLDAHHARGEAERLQMNAKNSNHCQGPRFPLESDIRVDQTFDPTEPG